MRGSLRQSVLLLALMALLALSALCTSPALAASTAGDVVAAESSEEGNGLFSIEGSVKLPREGGVQQQPGGAASSLSAARVLLNGGESVALVRADGSFRFPHVVGGKSYTLDVSLPAFDFPTLRIDVSAKAGQKGKITATQLPGRTRIPLPLVLRPVQRTAYFHAREPLNPFGMLKNPMVLMMLVTVFMAVVMPRMMSTMSPEEQAEMAKMQSTLSFDGLKKKLEAQKRELVQ
jgi:hypothetical protein